MMEKSVYVTYGAKMQVKAYLFTVVHSPAKQEK